MSKKNKLLNLIPKILFVFAILGLIILWLKYGGSGKYPNRNFIHNLYSLYPLAIGITLILPYFIYLFTSKYEKKKSLKSNTIEFNSYGITLSEYYDQKSKNNFFDIYIKNETLEKIIVNRKAFLETNSWHVFSTDKYRPMFLSNGIEFHIDKEQNLELTDYRNQVIGLGKEHFKKHDVPEYVDWAFIITKPFEGDKT